MTTELFALILCLKVRKDAYLNKRKLGSNVIFKKNAHLVVIRFYKVAWKEEGE